MVFTASSKCLHTARQGVTLIPSLPVLQALNGVCNDLVTVIKVRSKFTCAATAELIQGRPNYNSKKARISIVNWLITAPKESNYPSLDPSCASKIPQFQIEVGLDFQTLPGSICFGITLPYRRM